MNKEEAIEALNEGISFWGRVLGKFKQTSYWFREGKKRIEVSRLAIEAIRESLEREKGENDEREGEN